MTKRLVLALLTCAVLARSPLRRPARSTLTKLGSTPRSGGGAGRDRRLRRRAPSRPSSRTPRTTPSTSTTSPTRRRSTTRSQIDLSPYGAGPNSVDVSRDGLVAVAVEADPITAPGQRRALRHGRQSPAVVPGRARCPTCSRSRRTTEYLLVANEGEALSDADDPEGSVTVIKLNKKLSKSTVKTAELRRRPARRRVPDRLPGDALRAGRRARVHRRGRLRRRRS